MISRFFIDRPIFAAVLSIVIVLAGAVAIPSLPIAQYPDITPPTVQVSCSYPGANAQVVADTVAAPIEQQVNGVENMLYMSSQCTNDGAYVLTVTFELGTDSEDRPGAGAEPRAVGHAAVARPGAAAGRQHQEEDAQHPDGGQPLLARRPLRHLVPVELRHAPRPRRAAAPAGRERRDLPGRAGLQHPGLARSGEAGRSEHDRQRRGARRSRSRTTRWWPGSSASRLRRPGRISSRPLPPWAGWSSRNSSARSSSRPACRRRAARTRRWCGSATWPGSSSAPSNTTRRACMDGHAVGRPGRLPDAHGQRARYRPTASAKRWRS